MRSSRSGEPFAKDLTGSFLNTGNVYREICARCWIEIWVCGKSFKLRAARVVFILTINNWQYAKSC